MLKSPYHSEIDKNYLYYSKENNIKKSIYKLNINQKKNLQLIRSNNYDESFSIYSPSLIKFKNLYYMIYAGWKNSNEGNLKIATSKDLKKWIKKKKYLFELPQNIKIVSEPNIIKLKDYIYLFFEYKKNNTIWNISYKRVKLNKLLNNFI